MTDHTFLIILEFLEHTTDAGTFNHPDVLKFRKTISSTINQVTFKLDYVYWYDKNRDFYTQQRALLKNLQLFIACGNFSAECIEKFLVNRLEPLIKSLETANKKREGAKEYITSTGSTVFL